MQNDSIKKIKKQEDEQEHTIKMTTKNPSLGSALLMVLIVTAIFTFGLFSTVQSEGNKVTGAAGLEKVTGMATSDSSSKTTPYYWDSDKKWHDTQPTNMYWSKADFDSNGKLVKKIEYLPDGTKDYVAEYNPNTGNKIKATSYANGRVFYIAEYEYDLVTGKETKDTYYQSDGTTVDHIIKYDTNTGNELERTYYESDGRIVIKKVTKINLDNPPAGLTESSSGTTYTIFTDSQGNRIIVYNSGPDKGTVYRITDKTSVPNLDSITLTTVSQPPIGEEIKSEEPQLPTTPTTIVITKDTKINLDNPPAGLTESSSGTTYTIFTDSQGNRIIVYNSGPDKGTVYRITDKTSVPNLDSITLTTVSQPPTSVEEVKEAATTSTTQTLETLVFLTTTAGDNFIYNPATNKVYPGQTIDENEAPLSNYNYDPNTETLSWIDKGDQKAGSVKISNINTQQTTTIYENGKFTSSTSITYDRNGDATSYTIAENGKTTTATYAYDAKTKRYKFMCGSVECPDDNPALMQLRDIRHQSYRDFFSRLDFALNQFKGLSGFSSLIWGDDKLNEWRENVDKLFASAYLGTEYWTSEICKSNIESVPSNVAMVETAPGVFQASATISAERSPPVPFENATINITQKAVQYLYKISAYVKAVEEDTKFNIYVSSSSLNKPIFNETKTLDEGESFSLTGDAIIIKYSFNYYDTVCIVFESGDIDNTCNAIPESSGIVLEGTETGTTTTGGTTTSWEEW